MSKRFLELPMHDAIVMLPQAKDSPVLALKVIERRHGPPGQPAECNPQDVEGEGLSCFMQLADGSDCILTVRSVMCPRVGWLLMPISNDG